MKTKVSAKIVIGFVNGQHTYFPDAHVVYEDDTILYVGQNYPEPVDETIDFGESLISPGFIDLNALGDIDHDLIHHDATPALSKSLLWSQEYYDRGYHEVMNPEEEAYKSRYAYTQLIRHGVTTAMPITSVFYKKWAETYEELEAAVHHAGALGLRIYLGPSYQSSIRVVQPDGSILLAWDEEAGRQGLERAIRFVKTFDGAYDGRIRGMLAPERIESQTVETLQATKRASDELGCPLRLHAAQGAFEVEEIQRAFGKTPIQHLHDIGFLGPRVSIPHVVYVAGSRYLPHATSPDLDYLRDSQTNVIHCPVIMARHGSAMESFARYHKHGINIAIGTDTFPPDVLQNIRIGSYVAKIVDGSSVGNSFADLFNAATLGGAKALGRDDLGKLAPGAKADMIVIDNSDFHFGNQDDPLRTLFISASGQDVTTSIINGKVVMKDRQLPNVDLEDLRQSGQKYYNKMRKGYLERDYKHLGEEKLMPSSLPWFKKEGQG